MRRAIWLSEAVRAAILILGFTVILTIWPLRLWQRTIPEKGGGVRMEVSRQVDDAHDLIQDFTAQYDRLGSIDVWFEELTAGRYLDLSVFDDQMILIFHKYMDLGNETLPGVVRIPLGLELEVGRSYRLFFMGAYSGYTCGLQNIPADGSASPYLGALYMNDTSAENWHLDMTVNYRQPLGKRLSLLLILTIAALTVLAERGVAMAARKRGKDRDRVVTVGGALRAMLTPVFALCVLTLLILVLLGRFDQRPADIVFYLLGLLLTGAIGASFLLLPGRKGTMRRRLSPDNKIAIVIECAQAIAFALALQGTCDYMNGLYDIDHALASRKEALWLCVFFVLFLAGRSGDTAGKKPGAGEGRLRLNLFGVLALVFFLLLVIFRNGRLWGVALGALFAGGLLCYRFSGRRDSWLPVLTGGLFLHFLYGVGFCLLHRYFVAFVDARFPFVFHTVTVTAEYLTMMDAVAFALLFSAICRTPPGTAFKDLLAAVRTEGLLFGVISAYLLFTASRTGLLAILISVPVLLVAIGMRAPVRSAVGKGIAVAFLAVLFTFPAVFTLQRMLPVMAGHPYFFVIENIDPNLRGGINWDNRFLMSVERFTSVFLEKVAGVETEAYDFPEDRFNYDANGKPVFPRVVSDEEDSAALPVVIGDQPVPLAKEPEVDDADEDDEEEDNADWVANGRLTIWKSYLPQLNLTGHEDMGVELPDGEMAVHAHNVYLQTAHDSGLIAGIVFVGLILFAVISAAVYGGMKQKRTGREPDAAAAHTVPRRAFEEGAAWTPLALTVCFAVAGLTEWNFHLGNMMTLAMLASWIPLCFRKGSPLHAGRGKEEAAAHPDLKPEAAAEAEKK